MIIKQFADGNYYLCRTSVFLGKTRGKPKESKKSYRNWFLIKFNSINRGQLNAGNIIFPKEFIGKKVMLKVIVLDDYNYFRKIKLDN